MVGLQVRRDFHQHMDLEVEPVDAYESLARYPRYPNQTDLVVEFGWLEI